MPKIYLGLEKTFVCWHVEIQGRAHRSRPGFKEANEAGLTGLSLNSEEDGKLVGDLLSLWAEVTHSEVIVKWCWNTAIPTAGNYRDVTIGVLEVLLNREEDEWLLERYRDSLDMLDWHDLGRHGELLMAMLESAKRKDGYYEAVEALCRRVNSLQLKRPGRFRDSALWRKEERLRSLSKLESA